MPTYRIAWPDHPEFVEPTGPARKASTRTLRGTALMTVRPREVVVRRVPASVLVAEAHPPPS